MHEVVSSNLVTQVADNITTLGVKHQNGNHRAESIDNRLTKYCEPLFGKLESPLGRFQ